MVLLIFKRDFYTDLFSLSVMKLILFKLNWYRENLVCLLLQIHILLCYLLKT